jgi:hypothetical protein
MKDQQIILALLKNMLSDDLQIRKWLYGHNTYFGMSPDEMIQAGRSEEVIGYLMYQIEGPY